MQKLTDVKIGQKINSPRNNEGIIISKTKKTITALFTNGNRVKNTYRNMDDYFYEADF